MYFGEKCALSEELLREKYIKEGKTVKEIAQELGYGTMSISRYLKKYNIWKRGRMTSEFSENKKHSPRVLDPLEEDLSGQILFGREFLEPVIYSTPSPKKGWKTRCVKCKKIIMGTLSYFEAHPCRCWKNGKQLQNIFELVVVEGEKCWQMSDNSGHSCIISEEDRERVEKYYWFKIGDRNNWICRFTSPSAPGKMRCFHLSRYICGLFECSDRKNEIVDHINRNRDDNRKKNLRICTSAQNNVNRITSPKRGLPQGVLEADGSGFYGARIVRGNDIYSIGKFVSPNMASEQYNYASKFFSGEFALLNGDTGFSRPIKNVFVFANREEPLYVKLKEIFVYRGEMVGEVKIKKRFRRECLIKDISNLYGGVDYIFVDADDKIEYSKKYLTWFKSITKIIYGSESVESILLSIKENPFVPAAERRR